jgi:hypothetical protein
MGQRKDSYRSKKRKFRGNQSTGPKTAGNDDKTPPRTSETQKRKSTSAIKLGTAKRRKLETELWT